MHNLRINRKNRKPVSTYVLSGFIVMLTLLVAACPMLTAPPAMYAPTLIEGSEQLTVSWIDPTTWNWGENNAGNDITTYHLRYRHMSSESWTEITSGIIGTSHTITDLKNGMNYAVQVRAVNAQGTGGWSASAAATPTAFLAMSAPLLTVENGTITASWNALNGHNVTAYHLRYSEKDSGSWTEITKGITGTSYPIVGLTNGTSYDVQVRAVNAQGTGGWSASSTATFVTAPTAPGTMIAPTFEAGTGRLIATWTAPENDGGSPITGYELRYRTDDGAWTRISSGIACRARSEGQAEVCHFSFSFNPSYTGHTITGMTDSANYQMQVRAINAQGVSEWSATAMLPFATQLPAGSPASVPLSADSSNTLIANEGISLFVTTVGVSNITVVDGDITAVTSVATPDGVTIPTVDSSSGLITVTVSADTTAGTYVVYGTGTGDTLLFAEYFFVTENPTTNAQLKTAVTDGVTTWGNTANLNYIVTTAVTDMDTIFINNASFNGDISGWDVSSVTNMLSMFQLAGAFNRDISGWDVSSVTNMSSMFQNASAFNSDISGWDVSSVTTMSYMFAVASAFTQNLEEWKDHWTLETGNKLTTADPPKYTGTTQDMFYGSGVNETNGNVPSWYE